MRYIKSILGLLFLVLLTTYFGYAQSKIGWISSKTVMDSIPEFQDAQRQSVNLEAQYQGEFAKMQNGYQKKLQEYDKKKLILTDQLRSESEKELQELEKKMFDYRINKFGPNGELFSKRNEIMKPIQNKIFKVIQDIAKEDDYDYIFDKSGDILIMYSNDKYDLTQKVIERLTTIEK